MDFGITALIKLNLKLFLDYMFMRNGAYRNITSGTLFLDNSDMSQLLPDGFAHEKLFGVDFGQIWQLPFRDIIYEQGVPLDGTNVPEAAIPMSGVYVEGSFRPTNDPVFGHVIDFINARIIFNEPQSAALKVNADFSPRDVRVSFEHQFNQQFDDSVLQTQFSNNPLTSYNLVYPSGNIHPFPAVFIETKQREFSAYELGNRSSVIKETIRLHVWALNDLDRDNIVDVLTSQVYKNLPIIDFNMAPLPLSGIHNTLSYEYIPYQNLVHNDRIVTTVGSGIPIKYLAYINKVNSQTLQGVEAYERSVVDYEFEIYLNAPTTPLGQVFAAITSIPNINGLV